MRQYHSMFEKAGVAGDGMRGRATDSVTGKIGSQNPYSQWTADGNSAEDWQLVEDGNGDSFVQLVDCGKHYGHLEVNIKRFDSNRDVAAQITFTPIYSFPVLTGDGKLVNDETERRVYDDEIVLIVDQNGEVK